MCGIAGYYGKGNATEIAFKCLKNLEYRGYDSFGACLKTENGLFLFKKVGKISQFKDESLLPACNVAIMHSRWATHGHVSEKNAHPHTDCNDDIAVVHNGIIDNYEDLKKNLLSLGHKFRSDTDTEVIPHLVEEFNKNMDYDNAVFNALRMLKGSYAILILSKKEKNLYAARNGSPFVIGVSPDATYIASDIPAFLEFTNEVIYMNDGEIARIGEGILFYDISGKEIKKEVEVSDLSPESAMLNGFEHFMLKEICEQGDCIARSSNINENSLLAGASIIKSSKRIFLIACGTAYHASLLGQKFFSEYSGRIPLVILASEFDGVSKNINEHDCIIAVSQSGETADVISAVKNAKSKNAKIIAIVNTQGSSLCREAGVIIPINAGIEIAVASTKAFLCQVAALLLLASTLSDNQNLIRIKLKSLSNEINSFLENSLNEKIIDLIGKINTGHILIIGRNNCFPIALEGALKIKEVSNLIAEGYAGGELKHGPLALVENNTACIVICDDETKNDVLNNAMEIKARGGYIIGISPFESNVFDSHLPIPSVGKEEFLFSAIALQLIAYELGKANNRDIDHCRNLAKSVTVK